MLNIKVHANSASLFSNTNYNWFLTGDVSFLAGKPEGGKADRERCFLLNVRAPFMLLLLEICKVEAIISSRSSDDGMRPH